MLAHCPGETVRHIMHVHVICLLGMEMGEVRSKGQPRWPKYNICSIKAICLTKYYHNVFCIYHWICLIQLLSLYFMFVFYHVPKTVSRILGLQPIVFLYLILSVFPAYNVLSCICQLCNKEYMMLLMTMMMMISFGV